jgi:hypothetical protein
MSERINGALPDLLVWVVVFAVLAVYWPVAVVPPVTQPGEETPDHVAEKTSPVPLQRWQVTFLVPPQPLQLSPVHPTQAILPLPLQVVQVF